MDSVLAMTGKGYVIMAADTNHNRSILKQLDDVDKIVVVDPTKMINCLELDPGDRSNFLEYVQRNLHLHEFRTGTRLSTPAAAAWIRRQLADYLRSRSPFRVNLLLGGVDGDNVSLYYMDYLASCNKVDYAAQGYCGYMAPTVFDKYWKPDMELKDGMEVMNQVIAQLKKRLVFQQSEFIIKVLTKDGVTISRHKE